MKVFVQVRDDGSGMTVQALNEKASAVMNHLTEGVDIDKSKKVDNNNPDSGIMAVHVCMLGENRFGKIFSVAHYYEQNWDLMADPRMTFLLDGQGNWIPFEFYMDGIFAREEEAIVFESDTVAGWRKKMQHAHAVFAEQWMKNILHQQKLQIGAVPERRAI